MARSTDDGNGGPGNRPVVEHGRARLGKQVRRVFLNHLAATCNVRRAAAAAGSGASNFYNLRRLDPDFAAGWDAAVQAGYDRIEEALLARALAQVGDEPFDPDAVAIDLVDGAGADRAGDAAAPTVTGLADKVARVDVQFALALLARRAAAERTGRAKPSRRRPTAAEVETALNAKLDALARRVTPLGGHEG